MKACCYPSKFYQILVLIPLLIFSAAAYSAPVDENLWWQKDNLWQNTKQSLIDIVQHGNHALYLSGYAYHGHSTYDNEHLRNLNQNAWGLGYGKTLRNHRKNDESLYFFALTDSHKQAQIMAGYAYEWVWQLGNSPLEASIGVTAMLGSRQDYYHGAPLPFALPIAAIGTQKAKLMFSYVPRLSHQKNNGDVLLIFARWEF